MRLRLVLALSVLVLDACKSENEEPEQIPPGFVEIGPEGGELVDKGEKFPGFVLKIPPGALSSRVRVSFESAYDDTPLPPNAERVGPQVKIMPEGTVLAKPAQLTLMMDHDLRSQFEEPASDCKVWMREGDGWQKLEAIATTEDSVTVEISKLPSAAAAGVTSFARPVTCATCAPARTLLPSEPACTDPSGYCLVELPQSLFLPVQFLQTATVSNGHLYWANVTSTMSILTRRRDILAGTDVDYPQHPGGEAVGSLMTPPVQVEPDETVWFASGSRGNVRIPKQGLTTVFDFPGTDTIIPGAVTRPEAVSVLGTRVVRFTSSMQFSTAIRYFFSKEGSSAPVMMYTGSFSEQLAVRASGNSFMLRSSTRGVCTTPSNAVKCTPTRTFIDLPSYGAFAVSGPNIVAATTASSSTKQLHWRTNPPFPSGQPDAKVTLPAGASDIAIDEDGSKVYVINNGRPEIMIIDRANPTGVTSLPLTTLPPGTDEYNRMRARRIFFLPGKNELLLITGAGAGSSKLFRVRKAQ